MQITDFLALLEGVKGGGGQYTAKCPAHDDRRASLCISSGEDGRILLKCQAGCSAGNVAAALGLALTDLFPPKSPPAVYRYFDADGKLLGEKLRQEGKRFVWRRPAAGGWEYKKPAKIVPYNLPALLKSETVFLVEGEKDVDNLVRAGLPAACSPDGAGPGKWKSHYTGWFRNKTVYVIQDNDDVGKAFAQEEAAAISKAARSVKVLDLCGIWPELPEHGDVSDLLKHMGWDKAAVELLSLAGAAAEWTPGIDSSTPALVRASAIAYEPPKWLISPYIQKGKGTLIQADAGTGKTAFVCAIAAHVSTGRPLLDLPIAERGDVLILSVEDDLPVLRGRIEASGGDLNRCHFMANAAGLSFNSPIIEESIKQIGAKLIIFDPLQAFMGAKVDMFRANETRPELAKLFEMCGRNDCACVIIAHMGKNMGDKSPVNRALGSVDIPASMRSILQIIKNPDNEMERIAVHVKCSNAPRGRSITYSIGDRGGVHWIGFSPLTEDDLADAVRRKEKGVPYDNEPLVQVFNQLVTDKPGGGFWSYDDVKRIGAKLLGFPPFYSTADLKQKLSGPFLRELQERDGLIVTCGHRSQSQRGIRIEQYQHPQGYQTKLDD